ncbi:MAG: 3-hydroxyacyl-CoA dehydrogenase family protein [Bacteroidales bacterium]|nr:3-hydroxyacyl-CoA dehydrogenase family protein [Bacteroidales bacterium]
MSDRLEDFALSKQVVVSKGALSKVGVVGCGSMGQEIVRTISQQGIDVQFIDISEERVAEVIEKLNEQLDEKIARWGLTEGEKKAIMSRIKGSADYSDLKDCDLIIETINTKKRGTSLELRRDVFRKVEEVVSEDCVITSNTSTLVISDLALVLKRPERVVGMHFLTPVDQIKIVEVVRHALTNDATYEFALKFARMIGKDVINVHESPGNISTRMAVPIINEACHILMEGIASVKEIDQTMKIGHGHQFGPFEMADRIGLDKVLKWMNNLYLEFGEQKYKPSPIIRRLVRANHLGRKTEIGFYRYEGKEAVEQAVTCAEIKYR